MHALRRWSGLLLAMLMLQAGVAARAAEGDWVQLSGTGQVARADLDQIFVVQARALNLRQEPSTQTVPIGSIRKGEYVKKLSTTFNNVEGHNWLRVALADGSEGWVASEYLAAVSDAVWTVEGAAKFVERMAAMPEAQATIPAMPQISAGFLYVGPIGDAGWSYAHEQGRKAFEQLPFVTKADYVESVPGDSALVLQAIDKLVAAGHNLIFTTSYDHMDPTIEAARRYPNVVFMNCSGYKTAANAGTYFGRMYEARYLTGLIAGKMTKSNILGYVAAIPTSDVLYGINAFTIGAQSVNPQVEVRVLWTNTWYDPGIERAQADNLLDQGADVLALEQDSPTVIQAAAQRGVYAIGYQSDMGAFAPANTLTSAVYKWQPIYQEIGEALHNGTWRPDQIWWGLKQGAVGLAPINPIVPKNVVQLVEERRQQIIDGRLRPFEGPIEDANGNLRVPARQVMSDADLLTTDFLVRGVKGELPQAQAPAAETPSPTETN